MGWEKGRKGRDSGRKEGEKKGGRREEAKKRNLGDGMLNISVDERLNSIHHYIFHVWSGSLKPNSYHGRTLWGLVMAHGTFLH